MLPDNRRELLEVKEEAAYYCIDDLVAAVDDGLARYDATHMMSDKDVEDVLVRGCSTCYRYGLKNVYGYEVKDVAKFSHKIPLCSDRTLSLDVLQSKFPLAGGICDKNGKDMTMIDRIIYPAQGGWKINEYYVYPEKIIVYKTKNIKRHDEFERETIFTCCTGCLCE